MKKDIHPASYKPVIFYDKNGGLKVLTRSTASPGGQTMQWEDGNSYPVLELQISAASHPFYTGKKMAMDEMGAVARFRRKYGQKK